MKTLLAAIALVIACAGCGIHHTPSKEWEEAAREEAAEEYNYTNGMAWPSMTGPTEMVMSPGMRIYVKTAESEIEIAASKDYKRSYTWDGETRFATLWPRKERWYGSLGIYYPGPGEHWKSNHGITRGVLGEGVLWFDSEKSALTYLQKIKSLRNRVYTQDGLVIDWDKTPERKQLNVDVWQIMVSGAKPTNLPAVTTIKSF